MSVDAIAKLSGLVARPEGEWTLAEGALAIDRLEHDGSRESTVHARLDELGEAARRHLGVRCHPRFAARRLARVVLGEGGFTLVAPDAQQASHSFLTDVVESRCGTSLLLALVFHEVARRAGHRFELIGVPGRTLLTLGFGGEVLLFDPADEGRPLLREDVAQLGGPQQPFREGWLRPLERTQVLARILTSIKAEYWRSSDYARSLTAIRMLLEIRPDDPREIRDRGRILFMLKRYREAIEAFENYLAFHPYADDAEVVRMLIVEARQGLAQ